MCVYVCTCFIRPSWKPVYTFENSEINLKRCVLVVGTLFECMLTFLHGKLMVFQLVKKFRAFYGTRRFSTEYTTAHHLYLSWTKSGQCNSFRPNFIFFNIIPSKRRSSKCSLSGFFKKMCIFLFSLMRATCPADVIFLYLITRIIFGDEKL